MAPGYRTEPPAWSGSGGCLGLGKALGRWQARARQQAERAREGSEKESRRGNALGHALPAPALPGIPSHTLGVLGGSLQAAEGLGRVRGSVLALHTPGHALCHEKSGCNPWCLQARDGEVRAAPRHHVSGRKQGGAGEFSHLLILNQTLSHATCLHHWVILEQGCSRVAEMLGSEGRNGSRGSRQGEPLEISASASPP